MDAASGAYRDVFTAIPRGHRCGPPAGERCRDGFPAGAARHRPLALRPLEWFHPQVMIETMAIEHFDVLIIGAGLSGIGAGYHLQRECPGRSYAILESREAIGGTWDLFRYPGIRSDSDMYTLGYSFKPWTDPKAIADGPSILRYV